MKYPKNIIAKCNKIMEQRRTQALNLSDDRNKRLLISFPRLKEIERELSQTGGQISKAILTNPDTIAQQIQLLKEQNLKLQEERNQILRNNQYPSNYMEVAYHCKKCEDRGYVDAQKCGCLIELLKNELYETIGSLSILNKYTFDAFDLNYYPTASEYGSINPKENMRSIYDFAKNYAINFKQGSDNLVMIGNTGLGKTHLSVAIASTIIDRGFVVIYISAQNLMDKLEKEKFQKDYSASSETTFMDLILQSDLLVLDDLGTEFSTNFTVSCIYNIINTRAISGKSTIINTNIELPKMEDIYTQRIVSRLICDYKVLRFMGKDIRMLKKQNR